MQYDNYSSICNLIIRCSNQFFTTIFWVNSFFHGLIIFFGYPASHTTMVCLAHKKSESILSNAIFIFIWPEGEIKLYQCHHPSIMSIIIVWNHKSDNNNFSLASPRWFNLSVEHLLRCCGLRAGAVIQNKTLVFRGTGEKTQVSWWKPLKAQAGNNKLYQHAQKSNPVHIVVKRVWSTHSANLLPHALHLASTQEGDHNKCAIINNLAWLSVGLHYLVHPHKIFPTRFWLNLNAVKQVLFANTV